MAALAGGDPGRRRAVWQRATVLAGTHSTCAGSTLRDPPGELSDRRPTGCSPRGRRVPDQSWSAAGTHPDARAADRCARRTRRPGFRLRGAVRALECALRAGRYRRLQPGALPGPVMPAATWLLRAAAVAQ